ncbi:hypothetical protein QA644_23845 (plasmid) [Rhizobium sp. CC1099]|uniref:hypothetical protein n=1 Tax=Rhizobium sp. CC1099 TaxID=3039160 RepID=UPI0024B1F228|nr:hypothetical protein [Rhizobium sp. CC1099]WFU91238.1 hypothetical protein QA644_23845 [Rhizobium sp. CC1099]
MDKDGGHGSKEGNLYDQPEVRAPSRKQMPYDYSSQSEKDHPSQGSARDFTQIILQHDGHLLA